MTIGKAQAQRDQQCSHKELQAQGRAQDGNPTVSGDGARWHSHQLHPYLMMGIPHRCLELKVPWTSPWVLQFFPGACSARNGMPKVWHHTSATIPCSQLRRYGRTRNLTSKVQQPVFLQGSQGTVPLNQRGKSILNEDCTQDYLC